MIFNINGGKVNIVRGNESITIINGKVINSSNDCKGMKEIDEKKSVNAERIRSIKVNSDFVSLNVTTVDNSSKIEASLTGSIGSKSNIKLDFKEDGENLNISLKYNQINVSVGLKLDVFIPVKEYEKISIDSNSGKVLLSGNIYADKVKVKSLSGSVSILGKTCIDELNIDSTSGSVKLDEEVLAKKLKVKCLSGSVNSDSTFSTCNINCTNGSIKIYTKAREDIDIKVKTMSGSINLCLDNVGNLEFNSSVLSGSVKNTHKNSGEYSASVKASTLSGSIKVK